ncbi:MAG: hypothetical protein R6U55_15405 [Desulfovermiculus sp.]
MDDNHRRVMTIRCDAALHEAAKIVAHERRCTVNALTCNLLEMAVVCSPPAQKVLNSFRGAQAATED